MGYAEQSHKQRLRELSQAWNRVQSRQSNAGAGDLRPVILDVDDASRAEEVALIAEVHKRRYLNTFGDKAIIRQILPHLHRGKSVVVITDHNSPLCTGKHTHVIRLDCLSTTAERGAALELTRQMQLGENPTIAVSGSAGGAGVSTLAFLIADVLGSGGMNSVLIDAASASTGLDVALGVERVEGPRVAALPEAVPLNQLPHVGFTRMLSQSREGFRKLDIGACLGNMNESAVVIDCGRLDPEEPERWSGVLPDAHVIVCPMTVAGVAAAKIGLERAGDNGWPEPLAVLRQVPYSSATVALASVILDQLPAVIIDDDGRLAQDLDSGQVENYLNCYRDSPAKIAERAQEIPGAKTRSMQVGLSQAVAYTERGLERGMARSFGENRFTTHQRVKRAKPYQAAVEIVKAIQQQRSHNHLDIESLRLDVAGEVA